MLFTAIKHDCWVMSAHAPAHTNTHNMVFNMQLDENWKVLLLLDFITLKKKTTNVQIS